MRLDCRVQCLGVVDYKDGSIVVAARCQKDARHGHGKKRQGFLFHRTDVLLPGNINLIIRWDGIGIMPEWLAKKRAQYLATMERNKRERKIGNLTWNGEAPIHG